MPSDGGKAGFFGGIGQVIGGIAGAFGGQAPDPPKPSASFLPNTDPLAGGVASEAGLGIGVFDPQILNRTAPVTGLLSTIQSLPEGLATATEKQRAGQLLVKAQTMGLFAKFQNEVNAGVWAPDALHVFLLNQPHYILGPNQIQKLKNRTNIRGEGKNVTSVNGAGETILNPAKINALSDKTREDYLDLGDDEGAFAGLGALTSTLRRAGVDIPSFTAAQARFEEVTPGIQEKQEALAAEVLEGRMDLQSAITSMTKDLSALAESGFAGIGESPFAQSLLAQHNEDLAAQQQDILDRSGVGGFNPGRGLADLNKADRTFRDELPMNATERMFQAIAGLQAIQQPGLDNAAKASTDRANQNITAAQIAANQYAAFVAAQTQTNINNADNFGAGLNSAFSGAGTAIGGGLIGFSGPGGNPPNTSTGTGGAVPAFGI